ncbi:MAG: hypothetical protein VKN72_19610 [Nostocales cyanobacterium 94392]|nr:hypothetical protein [Nostocales cyanobacterium 94392]
MSSQATAWLFIELTKQQTEDLIWFMGNYQIIKKWTGTKSTNWLL